MEYHPDLQKSWALPLNLPHPRALPAQAVPSDDVDRLKLLSQIILRESPIQPDLPLLPQLIERQKLLRHLIYGPSASSSHIIPTTTTTPTNGMTSLNPLIQAQLAQLVPQRTMNPVTTTSAFTSLPSTSRTVIPTTAPSFQPAPQGPGKITDTHRNSSRSDTPIDVVHVDSVSGRSSPSDMTQSRKRKLSSDNTSPSSSLEISTSPHLFELSEKNFTEVFCKEGASVTCPPHQIVSDDRPNTQLIALLNRCVSNMKSLLSQRGVPVSVDDNGMPVDYSSRPVDAIFKQSRKQLEMARSYHSDKNKS